jgi:hypothetical protein
MNNFCNNIKLYAKNINKKMYDTLDSKNAEQYIYLGFLDKTFYFIHKVNNCNFSETITYYIYDIMICNKMINSNDNDIVIFEFNKNIQKIIIIQHETNNRKKNYTADHLLDIYRQLIEYNRNNIFVILYNYKSVDYYTFELEVKCPDIHLMLDNPELVYTTTKKNI